MAYSLTLGTLSFLLAVIWGDPLIYLLKKYRIGKVIRIEGPQRHQTKLGTPTMGGLMIILPVVTITVALNVANLWGMTLIGRSVLVPLFAAITYGALGAIDDWEGVRGPRRGLGLRAWQKMAGQLLLATVIALVLMWKLDIHSIAIPTIRNKIDLSYLYLPIAIFVIVGSSNAVNLTDGLDGLAGSLASLSFSAYGIIAFLQGQVWLAAFCFTVVGAIMAFLWFNAYPADLFMGDLGSLSLGATLGVVALMTGQWAILPIIAFPFVAEVLSVMIQVAYFKATGGKRVFKMSPLHHHFELLGWEETQVTQRFWLIGTLCAMLGVALALL